MTFQPLYIRWLGLKTYEDTWQAMRHFTDQRSENSPDEIWLLEHYPVFTQGQNGKAEHILAPGDIPVVKTDRGGQVTYHGPGQLMVYTLIDLKRQKMHVRGLVNALETAVIEFLRDQGISALSDCAAPGVYIEKEKICSIGLRIRKGCAYHGIAFNINLDLEPFSRINPCGFSQLKMTQLSSHCSLSDVHKTGLKLVNYLQKKLVYTAAHVFNLDEATLEDH